MQAYWSVSEKKRLYAYLNEKHPYQPVQPRCQFKVDGYIWKILQDFAKKKKKKKKERQPLGTGSCLPRIPLRKHAYSNILKILPPKKNENFQIKILIFFHISAQNIDCIIDCGYSLEPPRRGGSNEYP